MIVQITPQEKITLAAAIWRLAPGELVTAWVEPDLDQQPTA
jgi:hypothetical protein